MGLVCSRSLLELSPQPFYSLGCFLGPLPMPVWDSQKPSGIWGFIYSPRRLYLVPPPTSLPLTGHFRVTLPNCWDVMAQGTQAPPLLAV